MSTETDTTAQLLEPESTISMETKGVGSDSGFENTLGAAAAELPETPAVSKKAPAKPRSASKKATGSKKDEEVPEQQNTPPPAKKRGPRAKKDKAAKPELKSDTDDDEAGACDEANVTPVAASSSKKRGGQTDKGETDTSAKKRKTNGDTDAPTKTPKGKGAATGAADTPAKTSKARIAFPGSYEEFTEGDKLLVRMKKEGKPMDEIEKAWSALTGLVPGKDVLRKKENKLRPLAVEWKAGDVRKLAKFKAEVEQASAAAIKKLEAEKWAKVAEKFKDTGLEYSSSTLQRKWELMQKKGEVNGAGVYVGDDVEEDEAPQASGDEYEAENEE